MVNNINQFEEANQELHKKYLKLLLDPMCNPNVRWYLELEIKYVKLRGEQIGATQEMDDINDEMFAIYEDILTVEEKNFVKKYDG